MDMIKIEKLTKYYGKLLALDNLSLNIKEGEIFGFIGPNGAGKSTTIRCIMKLISSNNGEVYIDGENIKDNDTYKNKIGYLPSEVSLYKEMSVKEIFEYSNSFYDKDYKENINYLVERLDIDLNKKIEDLSFGNLKKVGIVLALMHEPKILILDEPTSGLDPLKQEVFFELLKEYQKKGTTIFFSSHNLSEVKRVCDRVGILRNGILVDIEKIKDLSHNDFVIVTIKSKNLKLNFDNVILKEKDVVKFVYKGDINELIKELSKVKVDLLKIEEPSLEEIFMHYYKGDEND